MAENTLSFKEKLDTMFLISIPAIEGHGEDSFCCSAGESSAIVSVFDGCGGLGARLYPNFREHTGAYVASRLVSGAVYDWFNDNRGRIPRSPDEIAGAIDGCIRNIFKEAEPYTAGTLKMRGSMVRDLPTTAAIALIEDLSDGLRLSTVWAGDSRVYIMDATGLAQLSTDDLDGEDAFSNLANDGEMTNVISSDGRFQLHSRSFKVSGPIMVFAATDGCFGYLPTPMDFENAILSSLMRASSPEDFRNRLAAEFKAVAGDDVAFAFASFNFGSFEQMKAVMRGRYDQLDAEYIQPLSKDRSRSTAAALWSRYRQNYERFLH